MCGTTPRRSGPGGGALTSESWPSGPGTDESCRSGRTDESCQSGGTDGVLPLSAAWTHEIGLPPETGIPRFWDITVPVNSRTGENTVHSFTARYRPEGPVSVLGSYTGTPHFTGRPRGQSMGKGRGRGPQAGTSGVQGRVYAVTQQAESADQSVIQGTFLLSRL